MEDLLKIELIKFGKRLQELRKVKGLSQLDLELETGIDRTEISRMERGLRNIEFYTIVKLAKGLSIAIKEFFI